MHRALVSTTAAVQDEHRDVVAGLAAVSLDRRLGELLGDLVGALAGEPCELLGEPVRVVALAAVADVEHPVGVENQRVADRRGRASASAITAA